MRLLEAVALFGSIGMDESRESKRLKRGNWQKIADYVGRGITNDQCFNRYEGENRTCFSIPFLPFPIIIFLPRLFNA
jgi:hypothetical protein